MLLNQGFKINVLICMQIALFPLYFYLSCYSKSKKRKALFQLYQTVTESKWHCSKTTTTTLYRIHTIHVVMAHILSYSSFFLLRKQASAHWGKITFFDLKFTWIWHLDKCEFCENMNFLKYVNFVKKCEF